MFEHQTALKRIDIKNELTPELTSALPRVLQSLSMFPLMDWLSCVNVNVDSSLLIVVTQGVAAEAYHTKWSSGLYPFFVKNLENVQGDERDVIFISTVYGKDSGGNFYQRFGPLNGKYGHRRLNVLFTRAKKQVRVFTSMKPEQIRVDESTASGVAVLRDYITYARDGHLELATVDGSAGPANDFEAWFIERLRDIGYEAVPQVGVAEYFIDIAIRDPDRPGSFLLGLECDGATYHSSKSARDRDRLRQEMLERLRWNIYRVWSTDWFNNPEAEFRKLRNHLTELRAVAVGV